LFGPGKQFPRNLSCQGAKGRVMKQIERQGELLESYLHGLTEHRNNLNEYLGGLAQEREELEREQRDLASKLEANEEKRERIVGYIEQIPQLRDITLRSVMRGMGEQDG
jgi:chromosome segregation ATPase